MLRNIKLDNQMCDSLPFPIQNANGIYKSGNSKMQSAKIENAKMQQCEIAKRVNTKAKLKNAKI